LQRKCKKLSAIYLDQANAKTLAIAERMGADPERARLCREIYTGALSDVAASFGLAWPVLTVKPVEVLAIGEAELCPLCGPESARLNASQD